MAEMLSGPELAGDTVVLEREAVGGVDETRAGDEVARSETNHAGRE
jgi:hypothetical protein